MKLPKWIRRTPKSNVGVKSIVKTSGHSSDGHGGSGGGGGGGGGHRHRRKTSSGSLKGKRKRNSYVSSAITTKNFYPAEHFFKTGPPPLDGSRVDEVERVARYRTLPASFGGALYQQGPQPFYYGPPAHRQQPHPLGLPPNGAVAVRTGAATVRYAGSVDHLHHDASYAPNSMQSAQHNGGAALQHERAVGSMLSGYPPHATHDRRRSFTPTGYQQHFATENGFATKAYQQGQMHSAHQQQQQQQQQQSQPPPPPPPPPLPQGYGGDRTRTRQILPTSTPGIYAPGSASFNQQQQQPHRRGSFRRYKIPSPAEIFDMINDKYIHPVGAGLAGRRKTAKFSSSDFVQIRAAD
uniref:Uncharacterized protein n=1 Tax=Anopheles dirus TaxID=7168 RepID=A0A182NSN1_9DIPT